jgi:hercynylcysteine S-oxide lyase
MMNGDTNSDKEKAGVPHDDAVVFGSAMRHSHFSFAGGYLPINHGSFGAFPKTVLEYQRQLQAECESRPDTFIRYTYPKLLQTARAAVAELLGSDADEVVFLQNATSCINTILWNLEFEDKDVIVHFNTIYPACLNTIRAIGETRSVGSQQVDITYPIQDDDIVNAFKTAIEMVKTKGNTPKLAVFDTVLTWPGIGFPWERLVATCKDLGVLSCVDGAHGIGHIDLAHLGHVAPDFFFSNCYKYVFLISL